MSMVGAYEYRLTWYKPEFCHQAHPRGYWGQSIIHALYETSAEIFKVLPSLFEEITNVEACLIIASSVFIATTVVVEDPFLIFL